MSELRKLTINLMNYSYQVMNMLEYQGCDIIPHLLDSDDNPGQRLRESIELARSYLGNMKNSEVPEGMDLDALELALQRCDELSPVHEDSFEGIVRKAARAYLNQGVNENTPLDKLRHLSYNDHTLEKEARHEKNR